MISNVSKLLTGTAVLAVVALAQAAPAQALTFEATYALANQLADPNSNFNPQGLGYDTGSNELLFMQQSAQTIYRTDLTGTITGSRAVGYNHTTSVAGDGTNYYFSDYTGNSGGLDVFAIGKASGSAAALSSEIAGYGGYPIDVRAGNLYRTEASTGYGYGNLDELRISSLAAPDTILQTLTLAGSVGIGDIAVDEAGGSVWTIDYLASAAIRRFDLATGALLETHLLGLDGLTAGITYADNKLYYYDWQNGSGSTLSVYAIPASVPEAASFGLLALGLAGLGLAARRRRTA